MSEKPISPLRQRMIDDMMARRVKEKVHGTNRAQCRHSRRAFDEAAYELFMLPPSAG